MASRLSRWALITLAGSAVIAALFLTSSGAPLLGYYGVDRWNDDRASDPAMIRKRALEQAINTTNYEISNARAGERLAPIRAVKADPYAYRYEGGELQADPAGSASMDSAWRALPRRDVRVRTVALFTDGYVSRRNPMVARLRDQGVCLAVIGGPRRDQALAIGSDAGECVYSEWFGWPGQGVRSWLDSLTWSGIQWNARERRRWWVDRQMESAAVASAWFTSGDQRDFYASSGWHWSPRARTYVACVSGRQDQCVTAFGLAGQWPQYPRHYGYYGSYSGDPTPTALLPRALFDELGSDRFGAIWRSDDPIAVSYHRVTGRPIDDWLMRWTQARSGFTQREIWLSLSGWVGVGVWLLLIGLWGALRFKDRSVA